MSNFGIFGLNKYQTSLKKKLISLQPISKSRRYNTTSRKVEGKCFVHFEQDTNKISQQSRITVDYYIEIVS